MFITQDLPQFKSLFVNKLKSMLSDDELGAFILVLANSQQDVFLKNELQDDLENKFTVLKNSFNAGNLTAAQDDADVFTQLLETELKDISVWQYKTAGEWQLALNSMRQLRPARASSQVLSSIKQAFDETRFHFNKPFLKPEILWQGEYHKINLRILYNKFPFSDYHLLIVVSPEKNSPQLLTQEMHQLVCAMAQDVETLFPGFAIGYNSLAAGASVNHMHFQAFVREKNFPIENECWKHNGGEAEYPLTVSRFDDADVGWRYLEELITQDIAFNCVYRGNVCYVVPRKYQGSVELPHWLTGAGWLDVAGVMTLSTIDLFESLTDDEIFNGLRLLRC